jgi:hypothetical protein
MVEIEDARPWQLWDEGRLLAACSSLPSHNIMCFCFFDNSVFYGLREEGEKLVPKKGAGRE